MNLVKIVLFGMNVGKHFMDLVEEFLHYKVGAFPFKYLELPVGVNPKKESN